MGVEDRPQAQGDLSGEGANVVNMTPREADAFFDRVKLLTDVDHAIQAAKRARVPAQVTQQGKPVQKRP